MAKGESLRHYVNCYKTGKLHTALCKSNRSHGQYMTYPRPKAGSTSVKQWFEYAAQEDYDVERCELCWGG